MEGTHESIMKSMIQIKGKIAIIKTNARVEFFSLRKDAETVTKDDY